MKRHLILTIAVTAILAGCAKETAITTADEPQPQTAEKSYVEQIDEWHAHRVERLKSEGGWLSVVGLEWIDEGENSLGSAPDSKLHLPDGKAPARVGSIFLENGKLRIEVQLDASVMYEGKPVTELDLVPDTSDGTTVLTLGTLTFYPIERGDRFGLRIKDSEAEAIAKFTGIERYPVDEKWRIVGRWVPYDPPKEITIENIIGMEESGTVDGSVEFEIDGQAYRLDPTPEEGSDQLFLIFADQTSGTETYGAGRYYYADPPDADGNVVIDFNKAYNPPCVFTTFATCPLPPPQNRLPVAITAGEKMWGAHDPGVPVEGSE